MAPISTPPVNAPAGHHAVAQTIARLHPWIDFVPQQQRRLGLFICLAIAVHVAAFFFVRIDSTRAELQHPVRTHVTVETEHSAASTDETSAFLDSLTDPRTFLLPTVSLERMSAGDAALTLPKINAQMDVPVPPPPSADLIYPVPASVTPSLQNEVAANLRPSRQGFSYDETAPPPMPKTQWQFDSALGTRIPDKVLQLPSPVFDADIAPTELRVAIDAQGSVQHVLLEETCQKPDLDQQAILAARKLRFPAVDQPGLVWTRLTVFWHATATPAEVVEPTPPSSTGP